MGMFDNVMGEGKDKLGGLVDEHADKIDQGMDKGSDLIGEKTGHKYDDKIEMGQTKAREALDGLDGQADDFQRDQQGQQDQQQG